MPDISKWNIYFPEDPNCFSSFNFNSNSISIKEIKSDSLISGDIEDNSNSHENSPSLENNNYNILSEDNIASNFSNNEKLEDYYDNFYN